MRCLQPVWLLLVALGVLSGCGAGTFGGTWGDILAPSGQQTQAAATGGTSSATTPLEADGVRRLPQPSLAKIYGVKNRERGVLPLALSNAQNGYAVSACDLNGDQVDDIVVGAPDSEGILPETTRSGWVYVVSGGSSLPSRLDLATQADAGFWAGRKSGVNRLGQSLACADFNGDGTLDLAIGAPLSRSRPFNRLHSGTVYLVFGRTNFKQTVDVSKQADVVIAGAEEGDRAGSALAAGDVNGDGIADLIIGAPGAYGYQNQQPGAGETYVILGRPRFPKGIDLFKNWNSRIFGIDGSDFEFSLKQNPPDQSGYAVGSGDVNRDGLDDVLIGAPFGDGFLNEHPEAGEAYVIYGRKQLPKNLHLARHADITLFGANAGDHTGSVFQVGRLTKNGGDLLTGAPGAVRRSRSKASRGIWHVLKGRSGHSKTYHLKPDAAHRLVSHADCGRPERLQTAPLSYGLGHSGVLLDWNRDGRDDLIAGVPCASGPGKKNHSGEIVFFEGRPDKKRSAPAAAYQPQGVLADEYFGYALAVGDVNGNGKSDLLIGAPGLTRGKKGAQSGGVYILKDLTGP